MAQDEATSRWSTERVLGIVAIALIALVGLGGYLASQFWQAYQPQRYAQMLRNDSPWMHDQAVRYFTGLGREAIPHLESLLDSDDRNQRIGAVYILRKLDRLDIVPEDKLIELYIRQARGNCAFEMAQFGQDPWGKGGWAELYAMGSKAYKAITSEVAFELRHDLAISLLSEHATREAMDALASLLDCTKSVSVWERGNDRGDIRIRDLAAQQMARLTGHTDLYPGFYEPRAKLDPRIDALRTWWTQHRSDSIDDMQREGIDRIMAKDNPDSPERGVATRIIGRSLEWDAPSKHRAAWQAVRDKPREVWLVSAFAEKGIDVARPWDEEKIARLVEVLGAQDEKLQNLRPGADWLLRQMFGTGPQLFEPPHTSLDGYVQADQWAMSITDIPGKWQRFINDPARPPLDKGTQPKASTRF